MASNKNTDAINQLLGTSGTSSVKKVSKADKPVTTAPVKEGKEKVSAFSSVITESNALRLEQYLYWTPGKRKKQDVVNAALKMFFDSRPESNKAIPGEE
jgi:hypothetical protein